MHAAEKYAGQPQPNGIYEWSALLESSGRRVTYWKLRLNLRRADIHDSQRLQRFQHELAIMDTGVNDKLYIQNNLSQAWQALRKVQQQAKQKRNKHLDVLAEHLAHHRNTKREQELKKIIPAETNRRVSAKHKWYLTSRHGMIRNLLVPEFIVHNMIPVVDMLALTALLSIYAKGGMENPNKYTAIISLLVVWSMGIQLYHLITHEGWKMLTDEKEITNNLIVRNGTHLSMSGDTTFAQGPLANLVGDDGEGGAVEEMLRGKFTLDTRELDEAAASSEMKSFISALKVPASKKSGSDVPEMSVEMKMEGYIRVFKKTAEATAS